MDSLENLDTDRTWIAPRQRLTIHWTRIWAALAVGALLGVLACWAVVIATDEPDPRDCPETVTVEYDDAGHSYWFCDG